jgi:hypothetical protein
MKKTKTIAKQNTVQPFRFKDLKRGDCLNLLDNTTEEETKDIQSVDASSLDRPVIL